MIGTNESGFIAHASSNVIAKTTTFMPEHRIYSTPFASVYPHYVRKAEAKGRTREELDEIIRWLTGYSRAGLAKQIEKRIDLSRPLRKGPKWRPNASLIKIERRKRMKSKLIAVCCLLLLTAASQTNYGQDGETKLVMKPGEVRILDDGSKVSLEKGNGDLMVITISKPKELGKTASIPVGDPGLVTSASQNAANFAKHYAQYQGTYKAWSDETFENKYYPVRQRIEIKLKIIAITNDGKVSAELFRYNTTSSLSGIIDSSGVLSLGGYVLSGEESKFTFSGKIDRESITSGTYTVIGPTGKATGSFQFAQRER